MQKIAFSKYTVREHGTTTLEEAKAEVMREIDVRRRLYDRWVAEARMSWVDANDRLKRLMTAFHYLLKVDHLLQQEPDRALTPDQEGVTLLIDQQPPAPPEAEAEFVPVEGK